MILEEKVGFEGGGSIYIYIYIRLIVMSEVCILIVVWALLLVWGPDLAYF